MPTTLQKVSEAIKILNWHYGRGDLRAVKLFLDGHIEFARAPFMMKTETRHGRLIGNTVHALGHQRKIA